MPTFLTGLPVHVLVVHAVVVLVPAAVLAAVAVALRRSWRRRFGWAAVVLTALATALIPAATSSGEGLEHQLPRTPALVAHTELGDQLLPFAAAMLVALFALVLLERRLARPELPEQGRPTPSQPGLTSAATAVLATRTRPLIAILAALTVAVAAVTAVQVVRIGDSGARAAWGDVLYAPQPTRPSRD